MGHFFISVRDFHGKSGRIHPIRLYQPAARCELKLILIRTRVNFFQILWIPCPCNNTTCILHRDTHILLQTKHMFQSSSRLQLFMFHENYFAAARNDHMYSQHEDFVLSLNKSVFALAPYDSACISVQHRHMKFWPTK